MQKFFIIAGMVAGTVLTTASNVGLAQCTDCQTGTISQGLWPHSGRNGRFAQARQNHAAYRADYREKAALIESRNEAWPMPFACQDRNSYFAIMSASYETGWIAQCCLTDVHFDTKTGELNLAGKNKVQSIMNNNPLDRRTVYIVHNVDVPQTEQRVNTVKGLVESWYGPELVNNVVVTDRRPTALSGARIDAINNQYKISTPAPVIQVGSSSGSSTNQ